MSNTKPVSLNTPISPPVIDMDPVLIVAIDRCEEAERNCFCASPWTEAPTLDAVAEGRSALRRGHRGPAVEELQRFLNVHHPEGEALDVDGRYGEKTEERVRSFQKKHGLRVDGVVGDETMRAMTDLLTRDILVDERFCALSDEVQRSALNRIEGSEGSPADRRRVAFLVTSEHFAALPAEAQQRILAARNTASMRFAAAYATMVADAKSAIE